MPSPAPHLFRPCSSPRHSHAAVYWMGYYRSSYYRGGPVQLHQLLALLDDAPGARAASALLSGGRLPT
jgi:hypothetical protein